MLERDFQKRVTDLCRHLGLRYYHTHDSRRSPAGFPDLVIVGNWVIFAELKAEGGRVSKDQLAWIDDLELAGADAYLWRPSDLDLISRVLQRLAGRRTA